MITYKLAKNAKWSNSGHTAINLIVDFDHILGEIPFRASPDDPELHGVEIFNRAVAGDFGDIAEFEAGNMPMVLLRNERTRLLTETDWWGTSDHTMTDAQKTYRQELRDLPNTQSPTLDLEGLLTNVAWPTKPE